MNVDTIMTTLLILMFVVIVGVVLFSLQDYVSSIDDKIDDVKSEYVSLKKHNKDVYETRNEDSELHKRIDQTNEKINTTFDGDYDSLKNKPDIFDGDYLKLKNKPEMNGDYNKLTNKPRLFDGNYNKLSNKPKLFDGNYDSLKNKPDVFDGNYDNLTNKPNVFDGDYNKLSNKPDIFDGDYDSLKNKPTKFPSDWNKVGGKPNKFETSWDKVDEKPTVFNTKWSMIDDKPVQFASAWESIDGKPDKFPTNWDLIEGKPPMSAPPGPIDTWDKAQIRELLNEKASKQHTHGIADIQGFDSNVSTMITDYTSKFALANHNHNITEINGLTGRLDNKQDKLTAGNNILISGNTISSQQADLSDYATTIELESSLANKQDTLTAGTNINISGNTISSQQADLSDYATTTALASGLANKQDTLTAGTNINISGNTISSQHADLSDYATTSALTTGLANKQNKVTGAITTVTDVDLGANKVIVSNGSGKIKGSSVSTSILNFLSGLTGNVQTQINNKQDKLTTAQTNALTKLASGGGDIKVYNKSIQNLFTKTININELSFLECGGKYYIPLTIVRVVYIAKTIQGLMNYRHQTHTYYITLMKSSSGNFTKFKLRGSQPVAFRNALNADGTEHKHYFLSSTSGNPYTDNWNSFKLTDNEFTFSTVLSDGGSVGNGGQIYSDISTSFMYESLD